MSKSSKGPQNYKAGYRAERKARDILLSWDFTVVRSAKSGGPFDLVGFNDTNFIFVQVKLCPFGKVFPFGKVRSELAGVKVPANATKQLWVYERRRGFHYFKID